MLIWLHSSTRFSSDDSSTCCTHTHTHTHSSLAFNTWIPSSSLPFDRAARRLKLHYSASLHLVQTRVLTFDDVCRWFHFPTRISVLPIRVHVKPLLIFGGLRQSPRIVPNMPANIRFVCPWWSSTPCSFKRVNHQKHRFGNNCFNHTLFMKNWKKK